MGVQFTVIKQSEIWGLSFQERQTKDVWVVLVADKEPTEWMAWYTYINRTLARLL